MNFAQRLKKLENNMRRFQQPLFEEAAAEELSDDEAADAIGDMLWNEEEREADFFQEDPPLYTAMRQWHASIAVAKRKGHTKYHVGLRPFAMAYWLVLKPGILEQWRTYGEWIWDDPPTRADTMAPEEFKKLDASEQAKLLRERNRRRGHSSKFEKR